MSERSLGAELWHRRVPHVVGGYVAASAGIVQFVDWLVGRYGLSTGLIDMTLLGLVLLLPTAVMLAWRHGQPGRNHWTKVERIGVPSNLLVAALVLFLSFQGQSVLRGGAPDAARQHLERALEVWEDADAGYGPADEARQLLDELGSG